MSYSIARTTTRGSIFALTLFTIALLATTVAQAQAPLAITLIEGADANGEPTYEATISNFNNQNINAYNLTVTYTMPPGELPISPSPSGGCLFTPASDHLRAVCSAAVLLANQSQTFTVAIHPVDTAPQDVTVVATESGGGSAHASTTSTITEVGLTEMQVDLSSTNPGKVGETFTYNVTVTNIQDDDARNVFAVLVLPKGSSAITVPKGCSKGITILCKFGQMSPGTSKTVSISVTPTISGWAQATAGIRLTTPDRYFPNNSSANSIWINP